MKNVKVFKFKFEMLTGYGKKKIFYAFYLYFFFIQVQFNEKYEVMITM